MPPVGAGDRGMEAGEQGLPVGKGYQVYEELGQPTHYTFSHDTEQPGASKLEVSKQDRLWIRGPGWVATTQSCEELRKWGLGSCSFQEVCSSVRALSHHHPRGQNVCGSRNAEHTGTLDVSKTCESRVSPTLSSQLWLLLQRALVHYPGFCGPSQLFCDFRAFGTLFPPPSAPGTHAVHKQTRRQNNN